MRSRARVPEASSPELTSTGASELVRVQARPRTISGVCARGVLARAHMHGPVRARARTSTDAHDLGRVRPRHPRPSSRPRARPSSCANEHGRVRSRAHAPEASSPRASRDRSRSPNPMCRGNTPAGIDARTIGLCRVVAPRTRSIPNRAPEAQGIGPRSLHHGNGRRSTSRDSARARAGGTDPHARIEAADPIDSARRGRSNPRPPPACATRRVEIDARASSFGLPETSLSAAVLLSLSGDTLPSRKARDTIREKKLKM